MSEIRKALELDPPNPLFNAMEGQILCLAGRHEESTQKLKTTIDLDPNFWLAHLFITRNYAVEQKWDEMIGSATKARDITNGNSEAMAALGYALARSGRKDEALVILKDLEARSRTEYVSAYAIAEVHLGLGDRVKALDALVLAYEQRDALMVFLKVEPRFAELRSEPRFEALLQRLKFDR